MLNYNCRYFNIKIDVMIERIQHFWKNTRPLPKIQLEDPSKDLFWKIEDPSSIGASMVCASLDGVL